jgi:CMP-N-acetylneuraminic acid synthetase
LIDSDIYILAHTTSPFLTSNTIESALTKVAYNEYDSALSVQKKETFVWYDGKPLNYELNNIPRTQDITPVFIETSGFFIFRKNIFIDYGRRIGFNPFLQEVSEIEAIDIDTKEDYELALKVNHQETQSPIY